MPLVIPFFSTNNGRAPRPTKGPQLGRVTFDWSVATSFSFDLTTQAIQAGSETIQAMFIDNSLNPTRVVIQFPATLQRIVIPRYSQGAVPVLGKITGLGGISCGSVTVPNSKTIIFFLDVPMPFHVWSAKGDNLQVNQASIPVPAGGSISTLLLANNPARRGFMIYTSTTTCTLYFTPAQNISATPTVWAFAQVAGSSSFYKETDPCYTGPVSAISSTANTVTVTEWIDDGLPTTSTSRPDGSPGASG